MEYFETVKEVIIDTLNCEPELVTETASLQEDLGADSLDIVDLIMALEDAFDVSVPDENLENVRTVGDIVALISGLKAE